MKRLKYDINAIVAIEEVTGQSIVQLFSNAEQLEKISLIRKIYWAGRLHEDKKLTLSAAGEELQECVSSGKPLAEVMEDATKAMMDTGIFPDRSEESEGNPTSPV